MATNLGILLVIAVTVGAFWLVLLSVLFRRQRRAFWRRPTAAPDSVVRVGWLRPSLETVGVVLTLLVILATALFLAWRGFGVHAAHRDHPRPAWHAPGVRVR